MTGRISSAVGDSRSSEGAVEQSSRMDDDGERCGLTDIDDDET